MQEYLYDIIKQSSSLTLDGYIFLGNYYADHGNMEKGRESLMFARAMQLAEKAPYAGIQEIESLAEKLGDKNLVNIPLNADILRQTGFICIDDISEKTQISKGLDEPVLFYENRNNNQIQTIAFSVIRSRNNSFNNSYKLLKIEKQGVNLNSSEFDGATESDGRWTAKSYLRKTNNASQPIELYIESNNDEKFTFTFLSGHYDQEEIVSNYIAD